MSFVRTALGRWKQPLVIILLAVAGVMLASAGSGRGATADELAVANSGEGHAASNSSTSVPHLSQQWGMTDYTIPVASRVDPTTTTEPSTTTTAAPTTTTVKATTTTRVPRTTTTLPPTPATSWKLKFSDDFNTPAGEGRFLSTYKNWTAYSAGWKDSSGNGTYDTSNITVADGIMSSHLYTDGTGKIHVAAPVPLINGGSGINANSSQLYGRYETRLRADSLVGYKAAWLLWPQSEIWPRDGEIDFPEGSLNETMNGFMHRRGATSGSQQDAFSTSVRYTAWHTLVLEWTPSRVTFIIDGKTIGTSTNAIPNTPMRWVLQNETNISSTKPAASIAGDVQVDYVKVWSYTP